MLKGEISFALLIWEVCSSVVWGVHRCANVWGCVDALCIALWVNIYLFLVCCFVEYCIPALSGTM